MFYYALLAFVLCGIVGVLIDIDHVIKYYLVPEWSIRFLHKPVFIVSCIVFCGLCTCLGRLVIKMVLGQE